MKLSPLDIYNKEFKKSTFGYNAAEVNDFLEEVGVAYEKLLKEMNSLQDEKERLMEKLANYENIEDKLKETLASVQKLVQEESKQAKKEADMIIKRAEMKAEQLINENRLKLQEEYKNLEELKETKEFFKIRFRTLLESHLQMLDNDKENHDSDADVAASELDFDE